jgi:hypothetical protein
MWRYLPLPIGTGMMKRKSGGTLAKPKFKVSDRIAMKDNSSITGTVRSVYGWAVFVNWDDGLAMAVPVDETDLRKVK